MLSIDDEKSKEAYYEILKEPFVRINIRKIVDFNKLNTDGMRFMGRVAELILKEIFDQYIDENYRK